MWQNYPHYWWERGNNALSVSHRQLRDQLVTNNSTAALPILYAFLTLIYVFFIPHSPVTGTMDIVFHCSDTEKSRTMEIKPYFYTVNYITYCYKVKSVRNVLKNEVCAGELRSRSIATSSLNGRGRGFYFIFTVIYFCIGTITLLCSSILKQISVKFWGSAGQRATVHTLFNYDAVK